jgi:hypothetical protein
MSVLPVRPSNVAIAAIRSPTNVKAAKDQLAVFNFEHTGAIFVTNILNIKVRNISSAMKIAG